ncbi:MAG: right-handed parallel beta-helix repeat-containing protein [Bacteroidales bacterium]|nr:right-handed parallel beta-helix repeat-containing protein [Bacteroidales bacterium]
MKTLYLLIAILFATLSCVSQTYMDPADNIEIPSNSWIIFNPGNYNLPDPGNDGLIQINGKQNIILDGSNVNLEGDNYYGKAIYINNSSYIEIKNFESVSHYFYAVYILNSDHININGNNFSYNKVDSTGWISIWTNYQQALGGGVMMYQTQYAQVTGNTMNMQNDGVALYHCDSILIHDNNFDWNTSYGIRMYFTDDCDIQNNQAAHINRPFTNPSDCAAILLIVSNNNYVVGNDFSYSGDGIFLGQFQYSQIPNNNYFAYNNCSFSPHNAIEATFADGNIYEYNNCNYSHYGFWLGYSFNSIVRNNEIIGNQYSGIAIDRGYNNQIYDNEISENPTGIELWEGDGIVPYQNQNSGDYNIYENLVEGNTVAISLKETEHSVIHENNFLNNRNGIYIEGDTENDTLTNNVFDGTALFHIENTSSETIFAENNDFVIDDEAIIDCKLSGNIDWQPFIAGDPVQWQNQFPLDMAEPGAEWYAYPEACWGYGLSEPTLVEWDYDEKLFGDASVHVSTGNGWDIGVMYRPAGDSMASWSFTEQDTLVFWLKSINNTGYGFQFCNVYLGNNCGGYFKYTASAITILNPTMGQWKQIKVVLSGVSPWARSAYGNISLSDISWVEIHADTWEYGFELWIDGVRFNGIFTNYNDPSKLNMITYQLSPNPASDEVSIMFDIPESGSLCVEIIDSVGKIDQVMFNKNFVTGSYSEVLDLRNYSAGLYYLKLAYKGNTQLIKLILTD